MRPEDMWNSVMTFICEDRFIPRWAVSLYSDQYSFERAAEAYAQAVDAFRKCNRREQLMYALYDEGLALSPRGLYSEALACLAEAQKIAIETNDVDNILNLASSIGSISILSSPDSVSLSKFKDELFALYDSYTSGAVPFRHYPVVGHLYFREHHLDSAYCYYAEYWASAPAVTSTNIGALAMLSRIEKQRKHYEAAWRYENLYAASSDSLNTVHSNQLIQHLEARYRTKYLERSYASLRAARRYEIATLVLVIVVIAIGGGVVVQSRKRAIAERNRKIAEYEQYIENARAMYGELQSRYDTIRASVKSDDARTETLFGLLGNRIQSLQKLLELASKYENDTPVFYQRFKEYVKVASGNNRQLSKDVIAIADLTCTGIIRYLHQHYPTLSQHELCYCGFICLGFSAESIRILYNHTNTYSIYTMRAKIRAKLNIKNNSLKLETYLLQIMEDLKH